MATSTLAVWGALLGWILMPRISRYRRLRALQPILAYALALALAVAVMYYFDYRNQAWQFFLGLTAQFAAFAAFAWLRVLVTRTGRK